MGNGPFSRLALGTIGGDPQQSRRRRLVAVSAVEGLGDQSAFHAYQIHAGFGERERAIPDLRRFWTRNTVSGSSKTMHSTTFLSSLTSPGQR